MRSVTGSMCQPYQPTSILFSTCLISTSLTVSSIYVILVSFHSFTLSFDTSSFHTITSTSTVHSYSSLIIPCSCFIQFILDSEILRNEPVTMSTVVNDVGHFQTLPLTVRALPGLLHLSVCTSIHVLIHRKVSRSGKEIHRSVNGVSF